MAADCTSPTVLLRQEHQLILKVARRLNSMFEGHNKEELEQLAAEIL